MAYEIKGSTAMNIAYELLTQFKVKILVEWSTNTKNKLMSTLIFGWMVVNSMVKLGSCIFRTCLKVEGRRGGGVVWFSVCGVLLDDCDNVH